MKLLKSTPTSATDENVLVAQKYIYQAYVHSLRERERWVSNYLPNPKLKSTLEFRV